MIVHYNFRYTVLGGGGAIPPPTTPPDCFLSSRSAYVRPGVGIECRPANPALPGVLRAIGVECLLFVVFVLLAGSLGILDGVWPGVLAAERGTIVDFLGVANSRIPEADRGRGRLWSEREWVWLWVAPRESCDDVDDQLRSSGRLRSKLRSRLRS